MSISRDKGLKEFFYGALVFTSRNLGGFAEQKLGNIGLNIGLNS